MVTISIELDDQLAGAVRELAALQRCRESEIVAEAIAAYTRSNRPLPIGLGNYRSGHSDTSENARAILRDAAGSQEWA